MEIYRDYGAFADMNLPNSLVTYTTRSQVWRATHDGEGRLLPSHRRSFISFSFAGKNIEEFNLIAVTNGDRLSRNGSSAFQDLTTNYDIMDGEYYHGTHFKPFELSLNLITDGMDEQELQNFLAWFRGGMTRELILAEHPNRAIMARVAETPKLELLPFEKKMQVRIGINNYDTSTTLYKGTINLSFISDTSFWYARNNIFLINTETGEITSELGIFSDDNVRRETLKVVYEDNVPTADIVMSTMHFGGDYYALVGDGVVYSRIAGPIDPSSPTTVPDNWATLSQQVGYYIEKVNGVNQYWCGARTYNNQILGRIAGTTLDQETNMISETYPPGMSTYEFFYGGTAPSPVTISFKMNLEPLSNSYYLNGIANTYAKVDNKDYSSIIIESLHQKNLDITTPNIMTSYNKLANIIHNQLIVGTTYWGDVASTLRDQIRHPAVRAWGVGMVNYLTSQNNSNYITSAGIITQGFVDWCIDMLPRFFQGTPGNWSDATFEFNSNMGLATGTFSYWKVVSSSASYDSINVVEEVVNSGQNVNFTTTTENVGDMLRSNWLLIEDRNYLNNGMVQNWSANEKSNAHRVTHNLPATISNLKITYKNMYL